MPKPVLLRILVPGGGGRENEGEGSRSPISTPRPSSKIPGDELNNCSPTPTPTPPSPRSFSAFYMLSPVFSLGSLPNKWKIFKRYLKQLQGPSSQLKGQHKQVKEKGLRKMTQPGTSAEGLEPRPLTALHSGPSTEPGHPGVLDWKRFCSFSREGGEKKDLPSTTGGCRPSTTTNNCIQTGSRTWGF